MFGSRRGRFLLDGLSLDILLFPAQVCDMSTAELLKYSQDLISLNNALLGLLNERNKEIAALRKEVAELNEEIDYAVSKHNELAEAVIALGGVFKRQAT